MSMTGDVDGTGPMRPLAPAAFCGLKARRQLVTDHLLSILRDHFAAPERIEEAALVDCVYSDPLPEEGGLAIEALGVWKAPLANRRPAVVVSPGPWTFSRFALGNVIERRRDGSVVVGREFRGSHGVACLAAESDQAELLAFEVMTRLLAFGDLDRRYMGLGQWEPKQLGAPAPQPADAPGPGGWSVPIAIEYGGQVGALVSQEGPVLANVRMKGLG